MSTDTRRKRCLNALRETLNRTRKKKPSDDILQELNERFLSPAGILESGSHELIQSGLGETEAQLLSLIPSLTRYTLRSSFGAHPKLNNLHAAAKYLETLFIGTSNEQFWVLCLDSSGKLIECRMLQEGTREETPLYISSLLQCAINNHADAIVLTHNHPGGTLRPSTPDINTTYKVLHALSSVNLPMLDHVIVADGQAVSIRENGFIPAAIWISQAPGNRLLRNWLSGA